MRVAGVVCRYENRTYHIDTRGHTAIHQSEEKIVCRVLESEHAILQDTLLAGREPVGRHGES